MEDGQEAVLKVDGECEMEGRCGGDKKLLKLH